MSQFFVDADAAPFPAAHCAIVLAFAAGGHPTLAAGLLEHAGGDRVDGRVQMGLPVKGGAGDTERTVALGGVAEAAGDIAGVCGDLGGDHALAHIVGIGQAQMLARRHITQERRPVVRRRRAADGAGDVVVARGNIRHQRAEDIKRCAVADFLLDFHIVLNLIERHVAGAFDHDLAALVPGALGQLAQRPQLGDLAGVGGVGDAAGTQPVAQRKTHIVLPHNVAQVVEQIEHRVLLVVGGHPLGQQRPAAADDAADAVFQQRQMLPEQPGVNREKVHALPGLLLDDS